MNPGEINFFSENDFKLERLEGYKAWLKNIAHSEGKTVGDLNFIFCDDAYLLDINLKYLQHDTYTDIISFDNSQNGILAGDIFISTERLTENATKFSVSSSEELLRVMAHGVLHLCGYRDKTSQERDEMRKKEDEKINMFHVEQ